MEQKMDQGMPDRDDPVEAIYLAEGDAVTGSHIALLSAHISRLASQIAALTDVVSSLAARVETPASVDTEPMVSQLAALTDVVASLVARAEQAPSPAVVMQPVAMKPAPAPVRIPDVEPQAVASTPPGRPFRSPIDAIDDWPNDTDIERFSARQRGEDIW